MAIRTLNRKLDASDAAAFQALRLSALQDCPEAFASSYEEERDIPLDDISRRLIPGDGHYVLGAFLDTALVGILGFQHESKRKLAHKAFVWGMYVAPAQRRHGIGRQLLDIALGMAQTLPGLRQVTIVVNSANSAALALYENVGFTAYGVEPGALMVAGKLHDETQMVHHLRTGA